MRLRQGDYSRETVFNTDPLAVAREWVAQGARFLHVVDLDGAREGRPVNTEIVRNIVQAAGVPCQLGGGLRSEENIALALGLGIDRVVIGTRAAQAPGWIEEMCRRFPGKIAVGVDARDGRVATQGWLEVSELTPLELARRLASLPLPALVYTDISRDGVLAGPNLGAMREMVAAVDLPVIASGGVTTIDDIRALAGAGIAGCIIGRALYEGKIHLTEVFQLEGME